MEAPVTRREMKEMFDLFAGALLARLDERFAEQRALTLALESSVNDRFAKIDERFVSFESSVNDRFAKIDERFVSFESSVNERFAEQRALILTVESSLITRMDGMYDAFRGVPERVSAVESEELPARVSKLESVVLAPKRRRAPRTRRTR